MSMPTFDEIMLPFLERMADGRVHSLRDLNTYLIDYFKLTDEEKNRMLPSGSQLMFYNRLGWARTYLKKALLIAAVSNGQFQITERGRQVLIQKPDKITHGYLMQFPEFASSIKSGGGTAISSGSGVEAGPETTKTPRELIDDCYQIIRNQLAEELLQNILSKPPVFFEHLVLDLLLKMGYGGSREDAAQVVGKSGDEGIDGIIKEDRLGLDIIYVQAKRWKDPVGSPDVQGFVGALQLKGAHKGIFITTSSFTPAAKNVAAKIGNRIVFIDGLRLAQLMIDFNVGVSTETAYEIKKIDTDYFTEQ